MVKMNAIAVDGEAVVTMLVKIQTITTLTLRLLNSEAHLHGSGASTLQDLPRQASESLHTVAYLRILSTP